MLISSWLNDPSGIPLVFQPCKSSKGILLFPAACPEFYSSCSLRFICTEAQIVKWSVSHFHRGLLVECWFNVWTQSLMCSGCPLCPQAAGEETELRGGESAGPGRVTRRPLRVQRCGWHLKRYQISLYCCGAFTAADTGLKVLKAGCPFLMMIAGVFVVFTDNKKSKWPFSRRSTVGVWLASSRCPAARCRWCALGLFWCALF